MISAFGPLAQWYAGQLGDSVDAIVTDEANLLPAYLESVRRRERGERFYGMLLSEDRRASLTAQIAVSLMQQHSGYDERRSLLEQLAAGRVVVNGTNAGELFAQVDQRLKLLAGEFFAMCSAVLVRSHTEYERLCSLMVRPRSYELVAYELTPPPVERRIASPPGVVLWSVWQGSAEVASVALALSDTHGPVTVVSGDGVPLDGLSVTVMRADDPRVGEALARAACVVTTQWTDPAWAIGFARQGYGMMVPASSGAQEYVRDAVRYVPGEVRNIRIGAGIAIASAASLRTLPPPPPPLSVAPPLPREELPLVTVVIPTYNRHDDLRACLGCIAAQTYPNVEAVVVNDAGSPVDDIVAAFPFARLIHKERNAGCYPAMYDGWQAARGRFVAFLSDDDWFFPDAIERLAYALIRSGAAVAHGTGLIRVQERGGDGALVTVGLNASVFNDSTIPAEALVSTPVAGHSLLWRREIFDEIGFWRMDLTMADQEVQLRAAQRYMFAFVDAMAVEWRIRGESTFKTDSALELERVFNELHPLPDRPLVNQIRAATVENVRNMNRNRKPGQPIFPPTIVLNKSAGN